MPSLVSNWTRFLHTVHVKCPGEMTVFFDVGEVKGGTLRLLWDDEVLKQVNARKKDVVNKHVEVLVKSTNKGGHGLTVEFTPTYPGALGLAHFRALSLKMEQQFSTCLDSKACLSNLGKTGVPGKTLKNSNHLLLQCLTVPNRLSTEFHRACRKWRSCLQKGGSDGIEGHLRMLLGAAGAVVPKKPSRSRRQRRRSSLQQQPNGASGSKTKCGLPTEAGSRVSFQNAMYKEYMYAAKSAGPGGAESPSVLQWIGQGVRPSARKDMQWHLIELEGGKYGVQNMENHNCHFASLSPLFAWQK